MGRRHGLVGGAHGAGCEAGGQKAAGGAQRVSWGAAPCQRGMVRCGQWPGGVGSAPAASTHCPSTTGRDQGREWAPVDQLRLKFGRLAAHSGLQWRRRSLK